MSYEVKLTINGDDLDSNGVRDLIKESLNHTAISTTIEYIEKLPEYDEETYALIFCDECMEDKHVERGTWALDNDMCEPCWSRVNGG